MYHDNEYSPEEIAAEDARRKSLKTKSTNPSYTIEEIEAEDKRRKGRKGQWSALQSIEDEIPVGPSKYEDASWAKKLPINLLAGLGQLGHNILSEPKREWSAIAPFIGKYIPQPKPFNYSSALGLPNTTADKIMQGLAENSLNMLSPAGELGLVGKGLQMIPKAGNFLAKAGTQIAPQATLGALSSENPEEGAKKAAIVQSLVEAVPGLGKVAKNFSETIHPVEYAGKTLSGIKQGLKESEEAARAEYEPFNKIAAQYKFKGLPKNYKQSLEENERYFTPDIKQLHRKFSEKPTLENAHKLQSQMFSDIKDLSKSREAGAIDKKQGLMMARNAIKDDIINTLEHINPGVAAKYKNGALITAREISPHYATPSLSHLITGEINKVKPERLKNALTTASEKTIRRNGSFEPIIPKEHSLRTALEDLNTKLNKGKAWQYGLPITAGALGAGALHGSGLGILGSLATGGALGHYGKDIAELIQNPELQKILMKAGKFGRNAVQPAIRGLFD